MQTGYIWHQYFSATYSRARNTTPVRFFETFICQHKHDDFCLDDYSTLIYEPDLSPEGLLKV